MSKDPQPLNFSTQCIQSWRDEGLIERPPQGWHFPALHDQLMTAVKFTIPDGGRLLDDARSILRVLPMLRLPFDCVALEYRATGTIAEHEAASTKRIALAWAKCPPFLKEQKFERSLFIQSIAFVDESNFWSPIPGVIEVDLDAEPNTSALETADPEYLELTKHRQTEKHNNIGYTTWAHLFSDEIAEQVGSYDRASTIITADSADEVLAVLCFGALTICGNVHRQPIAAPAALNAKRAKSGKTPFFETNVLTVNHNGYVVNDGASECGTGGRSHASPRAHLRRGHLRRLESKVVWVNAAAINHPQAGADASYVLARDRPRG